MSNETTFLYTIPSFLGGVSRTLDIGATFDIYNESKTPEEADIKALRTDWKAIGKDIRFAMNQYESKQKK